MNPSSHWQQSLRDFSKAMIFMRPRIWRFGTGIIGMSLFYACISVVESLMVKNIIDATVQRDFSLLIQGIILIIAAAIAVIIFIPFFQYMYNSCAKEGLADAQKTVFQHRGELPVQYFERHHSGNIVSKVFNDVGTMASLYTGKLRRFINPFIYGLASAVPMFLLDWRISSVLVGINALSAIINLKFSRPVRKLSEEIQKSESKLTERMINTIAGIQMIKIFPMRPVVKEQYRADNSENVEIKLKRANLSAALSSINSLLSNINYLGLLFVGTFLVAWGLTSLGTLFAIMNLQRRLNHAFLQVGELIPLIQESLAGSERIHQFLDQPVEPETYKEDGKGEHYIELLDVSFGYEENQTVLRQLSLSAQEGQMIALVGPSGGGKSTVMKLLLGFYGPDQGSISIGGLPLQGMTLDQLRSMIAYVPQDAYVFNGTIEENIRYGDLNASEDEVIAAAIAANAHDFILKLSEGYQTNIGERGMMLSGGQRQRIAIARAFLKNAPILLLDEATSALDSESERQVQEALEQLMKGRTVVAIAHRLSTIEHADVIYVLDKGKVVQLGTHHELLSMGGLYRLLYETQFNKTDSLITERVN